MTKENLFKILIDIDEITTRNLVNNGVSRYYIAKFVKANVIERVENGKYRLKDFNTFYSYGKKLLKNKFFEDSIKCFEKCIEIDCNHIPSYFQLLIANIHTENYNQVIKCLDILSNFGKIVDNERNYILYLLSNVVELPDDYKCELSSLMFDNIRYINYDDRFSYRENKIRGFCFQKEFYKARTNEKQILERGIFSNFNIIHNLLINKAYKSIKEKNQIIDGLIDKEQFKEAREMLEGEINPSKYNIYIKKLLDEIILINNTGVLSKTSMINASNVFEAIDGKNYSLALSLSNENNLLNKLLNIICKKTKEITNPKIEKRNNFSLNYFTKITRDNYFDLEKEINHICSVLLKKRGIYIMDSLNEKTTNELLQIFSLYPNLSPFLINYDLEDRIVLRYSPKKQRNIDVKNSFIYASYLFEYNCYQECLDMCLDILEIEERSIEVYVLLARTYMKLKRPKDARDCFMVAYHFTQTYDYANMVSILNGANYKQLLDINENEFFDDFGASITKKK